MRGVPKRERRSSQKGISDGRIIGLEAVYEEPADRRITEFCGQGERCLGGG